MKIFYPYKNKPKETQSFAKNYNTYYAESGKLGHSGIDYWQPHGTEILCGVDGYVFRVANKDNKDLMKFRAVYTLVEVDGVSYEIAYGHLGDIFVKEGDYVVVGDRLGTQSNTGNVASNGVKVTREMKALGSGAGSHLHFQVRLLKKVDKKDRTKNYLMDSPNGNIYEIPLFKNGFNGCIDPAPFIQNKTAYEYSTGLLSQIVNVFTPTEIVRTLRYGMRGDDVKKLQKYLGLKEDGVFGILTEKGVKDFQKKNKLKIDGIVGKITRAKMI